MRKQLAAVKIENANLKAQVNFVHKNKEAMKLVRHMYEELENRSVRRFQNILVASFSCVFLFDLLLFLFIYFL